MGARRLATFATLFLMSCVTARAEAQLAEALGVPTLPAWDPPGPAAPHATDLDRALLAAAGIGSGLAASAAVGGIVLGVGLLTQSSSSFTPLYASFVSALLTTLIAIPTGVFLFGNLGGRGGDFGRTLLFGVLGALLGGALIGLGGYIDEETNDDPAPYYVTGSVLAGVGLFAGSIVGFELD